MRLCACSAYRTGSNDGAIIQLHAIVVNDYRSRVGGWTADTSRREKPMTQDCLPPVTTTTRYGRARVTRAGTFHPALLANSFWVALLLGALGGAVACGGEDDGLPALVTAPECNPLGGIGCITPWPSSLYAIDDSTSPTGRRLDIPEGALPINSRDERVASARYNVRTGFSPAAPIMTVFPQSVDDSLLVSSVNIAASLEPESATVVIDMDTGERVPHFAEVDAAAANAPGRQALIIRPAMRLTGGHRYAVAIRNALKAPDGSDLPVPEGFSAILEERITEHALFERTRVRYPAIFDALADHGVTRDELVVAWDFTVIDDDFIHRDMLAARDAALPLMGEAGANLTYEIIDDEEQIEQPLVRRRIHGRYDAPLLLGNDAAYQSATLLLRDPATGLPTTDGVYRVPFWSIVPECAYGAAEPVPIMVYGHGLMGKGDQATGGDVRGAADAVCAVVIGTDMRGMSTSDLPAVASLLTDFNKTGMFEQQVQGIVNHIALQHIARGPMAETLFVDEITGESLVDPTNVIYYGLSQGHIFGSTFVAYDNFITRAVVGVGGANYSMMLERSSNFGTYRAIMAGAYLDPLDQQIGLNLVQMNWDVTDPSGSVTSALAGSIPGTPAKQFLLHMGHADEQVPNLATAWQARSMGIPLLGPAPYDVFGLETREGPLENALVVWHGGVADPPVGNIPPEDTDSHYVTRHQPAAWRQMKRFYETGEIINECNGPCMCAEGACE